MEPTISPILKIEPALAAAQIRITNVAVDHVTMSPRSTKLYGLFVVTYEFQWYNPVTKRYEWAKLAEMDTCLYDVYEKIYEHVEEYRKVMEGDSQGYYEYRYAEGKRHRPHASREKGQRTWGSLEV